MNQRGSHQSSPNTFAHESPRQALLRAFERIQEDLQHIPSSVATGLRADTQAALQNVKPEHVIRSFPKTALGAAALGGYLLGRSIFGTKQVGAGESPAEQPAGKPLQASTADKLQRLFSRQPVGRSEAQPQQFRDIALSMASDFFLTAAARYVADRFAATDAASKASEAAPSTVDGEFHSREAPRSGESHAVRQHSNGAGHTASLDGADYSARSIETVSAGIHQ